MITPILSLAGSSSTFPSISAVNYVRFAGGPSTAAPTATITLAESAIATAGTISNLEVSFPTTILTGTNPSTCNGVSEPGSCYAIQLVVGGSLQTLGCNVFTGQQTCSDSTHSITVAPGNIVAWAITPTNSPTVQAAQISISATFTSTVGQESPLFAGINSTLPATAAINYNAVGAATAWSATENVASSVVPTAGTIDQLYVQLSGAAGASATWTATLFHNTTATSLTCVTATNGSTCTDLTGGHAFTVAQGDTISLQTCPSNTATCPAGSAPSSRGVFASMRWVPTTQNEAPLFDVFSTVPTTTTTRWGPVNGSSSGSITTESDFNIAPVASGGMTIKKLTVLLAPTPGASGGISRAITLRSGSASVGTPGNVSCSIAGPSATTCTDNTNTYSAASGALLDWQWVPTGTNTALTQFKVSAVATVP